MARKRVFRGDRLEKLRNKLNKTEEEFAALLDIDQSRVNKYENGKKEPTTAIIVDIATKLGVTVDYLVGLAPEPNSKLSLSDLTDEANDFDESVENRGSKEAIEALSKQPPS